MKKIVLFFVTSRTQWNAIRDIALAMYARGLANVRIYVIDENEEEPLDLDIRGANIPVERILEIGQKVNVTGNSLYYETSGIAEHRQSPINDWIKSIVNPLPGIRFFKNLREKRKERRIISRRVVHLKERKEFFVQLIEKWSPVSVVVPGDRGLGDQPALLAACKALGVRSIIPPISFSCPEGILAKTRQHDRYRATGEFATKYPRQVWRDADSDAQLSFFPARDTYVLDQAGMLPESPWVLGGGFSSLVLVDSEVSKRFATERALSGEKWIVTGHPDVDRLYGNFIKRDQEKVKYKRKYSLPEEDPVTIINLPLFGDVGLSKNEEEELHNEILSKISQFFPNSMISAHPRVDQLYIRELARYYSLHLMQEKLVDLLPISDLFISDQSSTTIFWAILAEVPTISLNWGWYQAPTFAQQIEGHLMTETISEFVTALELMENSEFRSRKRRQPVSMKEIYGRFDGKAMERILETLVS
jgi:hypothetical protein